MKCGTFLWEYEIFDYAPRCHCGFLRYSIPSGCWFVGWYDEGRPYVAFDHSWRHGRPTTGLRASWMGPVRDFRGEPSLESVLELDVMAVLES